MLRIEDIPEDGIIVYDIETDSVYPSYCSLEMISYQLGLNSEPKLIDLEDGTQRDRFRELLMDPDIIKVSYNGINFDDIVLMRHGFYVEPKGRHDMFLALKTVEPNLPSYSLKFASWYYFGDWHEPQRRLNAWLAHNRKKRKQMYEAPEDVLGVYCQHDVRQTSNIFRLIWEVVQRPQHWKVYNEMELAMAEPLHEMVLTAGEWLDPLDIKKRILELKLERQKLIREVTKLSMGKITNAASPLQVSDYLVKENNIELALSKAGNYSLRKDDLVELMPKNPIAKCVFNIRDLGKVIQHYESHLRAAMFELKKRGDPVKLREWLDKEGIKIKLSKASLDHKFSISQLAYKGSNSYEAIPKGYTVSSARTRRFQSSSFWGINFQNQNKRTKVVALVPNGWLGCWIDSRQIENIVHIWASKDSVRREAYEADLDWNEYVWLCNTILEANYSRKELEAIVSEVNPSWSVYKQYKTSKLALNFFMGPAKFAKYSGVTEEQAVEMFAQVHAACPAIRNISLMLRQQLAEKGCISDPFGHIYRTGNSQKMVVHLVQGCGTGSVPKAMTVANYKTLHSLDSRQLLYRPCVYNRFKQRFSYGIVCGTTHDECSFRISLGLPEEKIVKLIKGCLYNMEQRFSPLFDNIPLRAQLALSLTNASEQIELDHRKPDFERKLLDEWIKPAKAKLQ